MIPLDDFDPTSLCTYDVCRRICVLMLRQLRQSTRCSPGCSENSCIPDSILGGYRCTNCNNTLVANEADGRCACPPGRYARNRSIGSLDCSDCSKGSYCIGGSFTLGGLMPQKVECGLDLTTMGMRASSVKACGECLMAHHDVGHQPEAGSSSTTNSPSPASQLLAVSLRQAQHTHTCAFPQVLSTTSTHTPSYGMADLHLTSL
jgi:hypothetical protein